MCCDFAFCCPLDLERRRGRDLPFAIQKPVDPRLGEANCIAQRLLRSTTKVDCLFNEITARHTPVIIGKLIGCQ